VQTAGTDDITVTTGNFGKIRVDLNTSVGIPAGNVVKIEIGTNATYGAIGDRQMRLASGTGSYPVTLYTYDASDNELDYGRSVFVIITPVSVGPVDTTDQIPPVILSAEPSGILQVGTRAVELFITTNEIAECRYATSSMSYALMPFNFYGTSTGLVYWHFAQESGLEDATEYAYFIRCVDFRNNEMDPDYELTFQVGITPGSATSTATSTGTGTGDGTLATSSCIGVDCVGDDPIGTGGGPTGTGSGDGPVGGDGSGSGTGGSGSSGGDKLPGADVLINGWAYPNATVYYIQDGIAVDSDSAGSDATFSNLTEGLDRGSYSFGVYAVDSKGTRSATFATTLWLQSETYSELSNVMLAPTLSVIENSISPGSPLIVTGYSAPNADISTWLRPKLAEVSTADVLATTTAFSNGSWSLTVPTTGLPEGTYELVAQGKMPDGSAESDKSARKTIGIGVTVEAGDCGSVGDLNCDGFINLVDFSILLFNWNTSNQVADINTDGIVSLPDFSIMLFYWTG